jgi:hypothetical protein
MNLGGAWDKETFELTSEVRRKLESCFAGKLREFENKWLLKSNRGVSIAFAYQFLVNSKVF